MALRRALGQAKAGSERRRKSNDRNKIFACSSVSTLPNR